MKRPPLPTGTVSFLFTDIEGSTALWERDDPAMRVALAKHDGIMRRVTVAAGGDVFKTVGDAAHCAFARPEDAVAAAVAAQRALSRGKWPANIGAPNVRMAIHTGTAQLRGGDYFGPTLNRVARLLGLARGGQILVSEASGVLLRDRLPDGFALRDLGSHWLRDMSARERAYQLLAPGLRSEFPPIASRDVAPDNLPAQLSSFVGRDDDLARITSTVREHRLVTVAGPGGMGKTRVAIEAARALRDAFPDGIFFVAFEPLETGSDVATVAAAGARALGVREAPGETLLDALAREIDKRSILLVADNVEHVLPSARALVKFLAERCPNAHVLATSREPTHIRGEMIVRLAPLDADDARSLFLVRASESSSELSTGQNDATDIAAICERLEGIPLAIELAAARSNTFGLHDLRERLDEPLRLLVSKDPSEGGRHRTLAATIDWSYRLLEDRDRRALQQLSVFRGGFTVATAIDVCRAGGDKAEDSTDAIESLADRSFLTKEVGSATRFTLSETISAFALTKASAEAETIAHAAHFDCFVRRSAHFTTGPGQRDAWLAELRTEIHNYVAAIARGIATQRGEVLALASAVAMYWELSGTVAEGRAWLDRIIAVSAFRENPAIAHVYRHASTLATMADDYAAAKHFAENAIEAFERIDDAIGATEGRFNLAVIAQRRGDHDDAQCGYLACLGDFRKWKHRGVIAAANNLAQLALRRSDYDAARAYLQEALAEADSLGDEAARYAVLGGTAMVERTAGDTAHAQGLLTEAIAGWRRLDRPDELTEALALSAILALDLDRGLDARRMADEGLEIAGRLNAPALYATALESLATVLANDRQFDAAAGCFGEAERIRERINFRYSPSAEIERARELTRLQLGDEGWTRAGKVPYTRVGSGDAVPVG